MKNIFHQKDLIYRLTPEGHWNYWACQLAHQHTGSPPSCGLLHTLHQAHVKGLGLDPQAEPRLLLPLQDLTHTCMLQGLGTQRSGCQVLNRELQESPCW